MATLEPARDDRGPLVRDGLAVVAIGLAGLTAVVIFLPAEGHVARPLHDGLALLLGRVTFLLPLALALTGALMLTRGVLPDVALPTRRLLGLALLVAATVPAHHFVAPDAAGLSGRWMAETLLEALGGFGSAAVLVPILLLGTLLTFDLVALAQRLWRGRAVR